MAYIELMLQSDGGVGKSVCTSALLEGLLAAGKNAIGLDWDFINRSLYGYATKAKERMEKAGVPYDAKKALAEFGGLPVQLVQLEGEDDDSGHLDRDRLNDIPAYIKNLNLPADGWIVCDIGANGMLDAAKWLTDGAMRALTRFHDVRVHTVISRKGDDLALTMDCLDKLLNERFPRDSFPNLPFCVWLNSFGGRIVDREGRTFDKTPLYLENRDRIAWIVKMPGKGKGEDRWCTRHYEDKESYGYSGSDAYPVQDENDAMYCGAMHTYWFKNIKPALEASGVLDDYAGFTAQPAADETASAA